MTDLEVTKWMDSLPRFTQARVLEWVKRTRLSPEDLRTIVDSAIIERRFKDVRRLDICRSAILNGATISSLRAKYSMSDTGVTGVIRCGVAFLAWHGVQARLHGQGIQEYIDTYFALEAADQKSCYDNGIIRMSASFRLATIEDNSLTLAQTRCMRTLSRSSLDTLKDVYTYCKDGKDLKDIKGVGEKYQQAFCDYCGRCLKVYNLACSKETV